jgi:hypothetical protein
MLFMSLLPNYATDCGAVNNLFSPVLMRCTVGALEVYQRNRPQFDSAESLSLLHIMMSSNDNSGSAVSFFDAPISGSSPVAKCGKWGQLKSFILPNYFNCCELT